MISLRPNVRMGLVGLALTTAGMAASGEEPALKHVVPKGLLIGAAVSERQVDGRDAIARRVVTRHFNSVTPENLLKWRPIHPQPDEYVFEPADRYVAFGEDHGLTVIGHTLIWHPQTPDWVFVGKDGGRADRETVLSRMRTHIEAVVGRYRGRIHGWDVVNEALNDDGTFRETPWLETVGEEYIAKAFEYAHAADPEAKLYYNDYNLWKPEKRAAALRIVKQLRQRGLRIDGVGEQAHYMLDSPSIGEIEATITALAGSRVQVMITELDIDVLPRDPEMRGADLPKQAEFLAETNLYPNGLPKAQQEQLARRYADIFTLVMRHRDKLSRVTFWGVTDGQSWLNNFPLRGRVNYPLLFDRQGQPKPAFNAVVDVLKGS
ncbi:MAG: 1,4-beta-xylanase [Luteitalea sp.]|nr:1,4-beta-xylanase [Luteitalea sp.]